ncbi:Dihydrodipicolinate synthase [Tepidanaerobacter acetatoxydans Re1]|uniref:Dihydrodipicolinate synthase n=1 Tax=Tepidanaerobacter acetatoxydans (strain DSM 21804 / JCM 16047 / Re1) TaxID=1209989 RepID=F4LXK9_TEPAE|nr:dihydrodipicolinate synthase family protein [Tepidanaerobacter acetatoxydans]AEE91938.1 Dihydrodipicolinate synthase [Tepidanaerobacter acetatoxydans Re1]CCP26765.1 Dihydrodipicolinate synthase [Tepidanaerobacter acetatoxydans Re1]
MKDTKFRGIICPVVTPFDVNGKIDETIFRREVKYLLNTGIHGISPGGSTGEGAALHDDELTRLVEIIQEENANQIPVVAGIIRNSTQDAIRAGLAVKKAGADALMVTPTYYNVLVPDNAGNYEFFKSIAEDVGLPVIIYNVVPQNEITPELFYRMLDVENIIGIKQSVGGIQAFYKMKLMCGNKGLIYSATDDMLYSTFALGADGAIAAILTLFPEQCLKIWDFVESGDYDGARALQDKMYPIWQIISGPQFPRRIKQALQFVGRYSGYCRSPILSASTVEKEKLEVLMKEL